MVFAGSRTAAALGRGLGMGGSGSGDTSGVLVSFLYPSLSLALEASPMAGAEGLNVLGNPILSFVGGHWEWPWSGRSGSRGCFADEK